MNNNAALANRLTRLFKCTVQSFRATENIPGELVISGKVITNLEPLGGYHKPATTKAGRLSLSGTLSGGPRVKVFSSFGYKQLALRLAVQQLQPIAGLHFPRVLAFDDHFIAEEWIEGAPLKKQPLAHLQTASNTVSEFLQACAIDASLQHLALQHQSSFCYLDDYLLARLQPWAPWQPVEKLLREWHFARHEVEKKLPVHLSHPDLSLANLVVQRGTSQLFVIDNELLGVGLGWVLDCKNAFISEYSQSTIWDEPTRHFANLAWRLRLVGSALDAGEFNRAAVIALGDPT